MQCEKCDSSLLRSLSLLPDHVKGFDALRASRLLRPIDTSDELGQTRRGGERNVAVVADQAREPAPACHVTWWPDRGLGVVVAGGDAAASPTLAAIDLLAALR